MDLSYSLDAAPEVFHEIAQVVDCPIFHYRIFDRTDFRFIQGYHHGFDEHLVKRFGAHYARLDPFQKMIVANPSANHVYTFADLDQINSTYREYIQEEYFQEFVRPQGIACPAGFSLKLDGAHSFIGGFLRAQKQETHPAWAVQFIGQLLPLVQKSLILQQQFGSLQLQNRVLEQTLGQIRWGAMVFDEKGQLEYQNEPARNLLEGRRDLRLHQRQLRASSPQLDRQIRRRLSPPYQRRLASGDWVVRCTEETGPPLLLRFLCLEDQPWDLDFLGTNPGTILLIGIPGEARIAPTMQIGQAFGLTKAEAKLARSVASGTDLRTYADSVGVAYETVRGQLKQVFGKTGCGSQTQLAVLLTSLP
ncbi:MAG: helix-turn-helix transcriptional regulator [bacterium]|nr:helix-turn-helix transcriptional regulator [bacterium]